MTDINYLEAFGNILIGIVMLASVPTLVAIKIAGTEGSTKFKKYLVLIGWPLIIGVIYFIWNPQSAFDVVVGIPALIFVGLIVGGLPYEWIEKQRTEKRKEEQSHWEDMQEKNEEISRLKSELERYSQGEDTEL